MKIIIVGGGIGGLACGLFLARSGHEVHLLEQAKTISNVGAGIQCGANANWVLNELGLMQTLSAVAVAPTTIEFKDFETGQALHRMKLGDHYERKYGQPYWNLHRADLIEALAASALGQSNLRCQFSTRCEDIVEHDDRVEVTTNKGQLEADLLIGADGIHSVVRPHLVGDYQPQFTGNVAWRVMVPAERLNQDWMPTITANFVGPRKHAVLYYVRAKKMVNLVGVVEDPDWQDSQWQSQAPWQQLKADFDGWHETVTSVINAVENEPCYRWALFDHEPIDQWHRKRVALLGDAAHASLPFMAAGASLALEDACILSRALTHEADLEQALSMYQNTRKARTARVQLTSRRAGQIYHFENRLMRKAAFKAIGLVASHNESFLPSYNAATATLN